MEWFPNKKVDQDQLLIMIGDTPIIQKNTRFWGSVPSSLIIGKPWMKYFSIEYRSYNRVMFGQGGGRDHQSLKAVCKDLPLNSNECREAWERHRYTIVGIEFGEMLIPFNLRNRGVFNNG